jgi:hypothetical protein
MMAALVALVLAPAALASSHHPTGEFANFGECPLSSAKVGTCIYSKSSSGEFKVGNKAVPLVNPVTLQGGLIGSGEASEFVGAENGETLSKTPQPVPGGLLGITAPTWWPSFIQSWFNNQINEGLTGVTATVELAKPASAVKVNVNNLIEEKGTALGLPVKVKLSNGILGNSCYLGSNSSPIQINFTTGTSGSLKGTRGVAEFNEEFTLVTLKGGKLVNATFSAPGVNGCGGIFSFLVDPLVESILGVPAGEGKNKAILEGVLQSGQRTAVEESE